MLNELLIVLTATSSVSGIIAIIFVIWEHIKDDRRLAKRVQGFYEDIENYVYSSIKIAVNSHLYNQIPNDRSNIVEEYLNCLRIKQTSLGFIRQKFNEYSKYLGITMNRQNQIINHSDIRIKLHIKSYEDIVLIERTDDMDLNRRIRPSCIPLINNLPEITFEELNIIKNYFVSLRAYWKEHYRKSFLKIIRIKPKLKRKIDFDDLKIEKQNF